MHPITVRHEALELVARGHSLSAVSRRLGISRAAIRAWRLTGVQPRRQEVCDVCAGEVVQSQPSYAQLLGFYLGDGCISPSRHSFVLRVSCDATYPGIIEDVSGCIEAIHRSGKATRVNAPGVVVVQNGWRHWPCLFPQHGPGRKHERTLTLEPWQRKILELHPADFLRGLFHSDGCRVNNWATRMVAGEKKRYAYPRWQFTNNSADIMAWCQWALDLVDMPWRQSSWKTLSVSTREAVARLDASIGPKT